MKKSEREPVLPGIEEFFSRKTKEEAQEEQEFFWKLSSVVNAKEAREIEISSGMSEDEEKRKLVRARDLAKKYKIPFPESIGRELREWEGAWGYSEIKKTKGHKQPFDILDRIHYQVPLSLKGFKVETTAESIRWSKKIGNREVSLFIYLGKNMAITKPAYGDLAKRSIMAMIKFARLRDTVDPGPITFRQVLEQLGMLGCSHVTRQNIRHYLASFRVSGLSIVEKDEKGREIYSDFAPIFKRFIWDGRLELDSKIYPIFNEEFGKMLLEQNLNQYLWVTDERLKPQKRLGDRDRLVQDKFQMIQGLTRIHFKLRNWLVNFAQFTDSEIETWSLKKIRDYVNRSFLLAVQNRRIRSVSLETIHSYHSKQKYLNQVIIIYPLKPEAPETLKARLTPQEEQLINEVIKWGYDPENKFYIKNPESETQQQLTNIINTYGIQTVQDPFELWREKELQEENWYPDGQSNWMRFWDDVKLNIKNQKPNLLL